MKRRWIIACMTLIAAPASGEQLFAPTLLGETDYRVYSSETEGATGFAVARFRPGLQLAPLDWARVIASIELAQKEPTLVDAFARLDIDPVTVTLGFAKTPLFNSFLHQPVGDLAFGEFSTTVRSFGGHRDVGVSVELARAGLPIEAVARVGNGSRSPLGNDDFMPAGYASTHVVLGAEQRGSAAPYGLRLGLAGMIESTPDREGITVATPLRFKAYRAAIVHGFRGIGAANLTASAPRLRLTVDVAAGREHRAFDHDGNPATARLPADPVTSYAVTTEAVATPLGGAAAARLDIGARFERLWLGRGTDEVRPSGATFAVLAAKWWPTPYFALSVEGYLGRLDAAPIEHPAEHFTAGSFLRATVHWTAAQQLGGS